MDDETRRFRYRELRDAHPELFVNPPDAPFQILDDPADMAAAEDAAVRVLTEQGRPTSWGHTGVVFEDAYSITLRDPVRKPTGSIGTYFRRISPGNAPGVVVLPVHEGNVVLVRHFRHSTRQWHLEVPRGFGTPGSSPEEDARRELLEEIGADPTTLTSLGEVYPDTGQMATPVLLYYAEVAWIHTAGREEGIGSLRTVTPVGLAEQIRTGEITDGFTINAYTRAVLRGLLPGGSVLGT
jgi:ADP-ribose pyrophosphatase